MDANAISTVAASISAVAALASIGLTIWNVRVVAQTVSEMRAARQPVVFVDLEILGLAEVVLIIGNSGDAPARHVEFEVRDGIPWEPHASWTPADLRVLTNGLPYLAPGRALRFRLGHVDWKQATERGGSLNVKTTFEGEEGRSFVQRANIDLRRYAGISVDTFSHPEREIVEVLQEMQHLAREVAERGKPNATTKWCPACARPMPYGAKKCAECGEWLPGSAEATSSGAS